MRNKYKNPFNKLSHLIILLLVSVLFCSCFVSNEEQKQMILEKPVSIESVEADETSQNINVSSDQLKNGMEFIFEKNTFSTKTEINISTEKVKDHDLGENFTPLTPLIDIQFDDSQLTKPFIVTVPIDVSDGHTAIAVTYNKAKKSFETIPSTLVDEIMMEVLISSSANFIITEIAKDLLFSEISSDFLPSKDGMQIANTSTYWTPSGMCNGINIGVLYYYEHMRQKNGALFNRYMENSQIKDFKTPEFYLDDNDMYLLASSLQNIDSPPQYMSWLEKTKDDESLVHYLRMAYTMLLTKKPQTVHVFKDKVFSQSNIGHTLIVYRINGNKAYVYEPNQPKNDNISIEIDLEKLSFVPYRGSYNNLSDEMSFKYLYYLNYSNLIDDAKVSTVWQSALDQQLNGKFPNVDFVEIVKKPDGSEFQILLNKQHVSSLEEIKIKIEAPFSAKLEVYDQNQQLLVSGNKNGPVILSLKAGENIFGLQVLAEQYDTILKANTWSWTYFTWVSIERKEYEKWTLSSEIVKAYPGTGLTEAQIKEVEGYRIQSLVYMLYNSDTNGFLARNPENGEQWVINIDGQKVDFTIVKIVEKDETLSSSFVGTINQTMDRIEGTTRLTSSVSGLLYEFNDVLTKNE
ncbi:MAG: hypothetical protein KMY54_03850 [Erysipelothrix sp.]|nr:hypothetical protein [Erysipelothrix sp.]